jgi:hypothetical protein
MGFLAAESTSTAPPLSPYVHHRHRAGWRRRHRLAWALLLVVAFLYGALFALFPPAFVPPMLLPLVLVILVVIWALPDSDVAPTRLLYWLFSGFFLTLIAWPTYLAVALPGLPWISFIRLFGFPLGLVLLVSLSISNTVSGDLKEVLRQTPMVWKFLAAFVLFQFISIFFSAQPFISLEKFIIAQVYWTAVFFSCCYLFRTPGRAATWALLMAILALWVCLIGLWEWRLSHVPWAGHIPSIFRIDDESVARILAGSARAATGIYRVQATATTSLSLAEFLALTTPFLIHFVMEDKRWWLKAGAVVLLPFLFFTIINTGARLGALGFFLSFLLYLGLWAIRRWRTDKGSVFGPAISIAYPMIFGMFLVATMFIGRLHRIVWGGGETQFSTDARFEQMHTGLPMIFTHPLGHGIGRAAAELGFTDGEGLLTIDNYLLSIGLEYGIPGFIAYFGMFVAAIVYGLKALMRVDLDDDGKYLVPVVVALTVFVVVKTVLSQEANHPVAFMLLGIACALVWRSSRPMVADEPS